MKYSMLIFLFIFFSCGNKKDILLPKSNVTLVKDIQDHSPIYIFFKINGKDTVADVNRKNSIITTNWILNIDKRLPLRLVIPEVIKLQQKKREEKAHKNEAALNYYSYADSIGKNMAFIPFTEVYYKMGKPKSGTVVFFNKNNEISTEKFNNMMYVCKLFEKELMVMNKDQGKNFNRIITENEYLRKVISNSQIIQNGLNSNFNHSKINNISISNNVNKQDDISKLLNKQ